MTTITIVLIAVLVIRRTKLSALVVSAALAGEAVLSHWSPIYSQVHQGLWLIGLNLLLAFGCVVHWKNNNNEVSKCITWLAFAAASLSFTRLIIFSTVDNVGLHESMQGALTECFDWVTMAMAACLLLLPDKPVYLNDLVRNLSARAVRVRDSLDILTNRVR